MFHQTVSSNRNQSLKKSSEINWIYYKKNFEVNNFTDGLSDLNLFLSHIKPQSYAVIWLEIELLIDYRYEYYGTIKIRTFSIILNEMYSNVQGCRILHRLSTIEWCRLKNYYWWAKMWIESWLFASNELNVFFYDRWLWLRFVNQKHLPPICRFKLK